MFKSNLLVLVEAHTLQVAVACQATDQQSRNVKDECLFNEDDVMFSDGEAVVVGRCTAPSWLQRSYDLHSLEVKATVAGH